MSVCLSVRLHISKTTYPNFTKFSVDASCGRCNRLCILPVLYVTSCFHIMGHYTNRTFPSYFNLIRQRAPAAYPLTVKNVDCVSHCCCRCYFRERLCGRGWSLLSSIALFYVQLGLNLISIMMNWVSRHIGRSDCDTFLRISNFSEVIHTFLKLLRDQEIRNFS